ncbi:uncharacterized protein LOC114189165 [Vigna unguiculata]|uniref:uncharacterized protein LOC114189165 n=1 Tax=Vigna unguiculata TaxID=3917 RepID=UPI001016685F|nr:uncharacterized protein LOC114189165 [Vigna unguiculata]
MKLNINFITLFSITLVLCFAICIVHASDAEEPESASEELTNSTADQATAEAAESEDSASTDSASTDSASTDSASAETLAEPPTEEAESADPPSEEATTEAPAEQATDTPAEKETESADPPSEEAESANAPSEDQPSEDSVAAEAPSEDLDSADPPSEGQEPEELVSEDLSIADAPAAESPNSEEQARFEEGFFGGGGGGQLKKAFSSFFAEIRMGSLRGSKTITMLNHFNRHDRDSVKEICSRTDYPDDCLSTVVPFLGNKFDLMSVLDAAIKACSFQTNYTISIVEKHMKSSSEMATALANCKEQYTNALQSLQQALTALTSHDLGTVTVMLSSVMADVSACESGFEDLKLARTRAEGMVSVTVSNCLSIASMIPS